MMSKVEVNGSMMHPVYQFLRSQITDRQGSTLKWNYTKFLVDRRGIPRRRYGPTREPYTFARDIAALLQH